MKVEEANKMSVQEMLDFMIDKIVEQGGQCSYPDGVCAYANEKSMHCAVGWLLDESCDELMGEEGNVIDIVCEASDGKYKIPDAITKDTRLFSRVQLIHDLTRTEVRLNHLKILKREHPQYNFDNPNWMKWVEMGEA